MKGWSSTHRLFVLALVVRLGCIAVGVDVPPQDTPDYDEIAHNLMAGEGFVSHDTFFGHPMRSWRAPLYPVMLALIYSIFGSHHLAVLVVQAFIGAFTVVGILLLARRLHRPSAMTVAILVAVYPPLVTNTAEVMTETLFTSLLVAAAAVGLGSDRRLAWWGAGALVGLATLTRPVGLLLAPALLLPQWLALWQLHRSRRGQIRDLIRRSGWMLAGLLLVLSPWTLRNAAVHKAFVPVSTHGGFILARSNADAPDWRREDGWQIRSSTFVEIPDEVERDRAWRAQGRQWIVEHPIQWGRLVAERFLRLWYVFRPDYNIGFMLMMPLMIVGAIRYGSSRAYQEISLFAVLSIVLFSTLLYGSTRFRLPLEPFFLLFAGRALQEAWTSTGRSRWISWVAAWSLVQLLIWWQQDTVRAILVSLLRAGGLK